VAGGRRDGETAAAYAARAVEHDYEFLRGWCTDQWAYVGVVVEHLDDDGAPVPGRSESLWGVDTYDDAYPRTVAHELIDELLHQIEVPNPDIQLSEN